MGLFRFLTRYFPAAAWGRSRDSLPEPGENPSADRGRDLRGYSRHRVSFPVIVCAEGTGWDEDGEKTILQDVSEGGALFSSAAPENYYPGQVLQIFIMIDGARDVKARMKTEAIVLRVSRKGSTKSVQAGCTEASVAVKFSRSFDFERIDNNNFGPVE